MYRQSVRLLHTTSAARAAAQATALVKPSLQLFGIEGRYAHALFSAASKQGKLDQVEKELKSLKKAIDGSKKFQGFLDDPTKSRAEKTATVKKALSNISPTTLNFFTTLAENNRLQNTREILNAFESLMSSHRSEVQCTVTSAEALDEKTLKSLSEALQGFAKKGEVLKLSTKVDPTIKGGLVVDVGDKHIDMSIATRVKKYSQILRVPL